MNLKENAGPVTASILTVPHSKKNILSLLTRRTNWALPAVLTLALVVRLYVWWQVPPGGFVIDEAEYYQIASILADGRGWAFYDEATWVRPPLYVMMLASIFKLFGPNLIIVRLVQVGLSVASVYLLYRLASRTFSRRIGLITGILAALAWPFAVLAYLLLSETLFIFLFLVAINLLSAFMSGTRIANYSFGKDKRAWALLGASGICLGLSALTRGQVLSFIPFIGLWLWFEMGRARWREALAAFAIIIAVFGLVIVPWSFRNYSLYGRPFIDTTGGYNFYLGSLNGRNGALVSQTLEAIENHAVRETLGYSKGLEVLAKDPLNFLNKGFKESLDFWNINFGADERLENGYTQGLIAPSWLVPDLLLGDTFYLVAVFLALLGIVTAVYRPSHIANGFSSFVVIWLGYNMALAFAFFAVSRFRLPVYYFLLPFAAYPLAHPGAVITWLKRPLSLAGRHIYYGRWAVGLALPALFLLITLPTYLPDQTVIGIQEWNKQQHAGQGTELRRQGKYTEALAEYARAAQRLPSTQIGIGLTEALQGKYDDAIGRIGRTSQDIAQSHLALGWIYLRQGNQEYAHGEFRTRQVALDLQSDRWAWTNLETRPLVGNRLQIGEFDWGYVKGFHIYEKEDNKAGSPYFRWSASLGADGQQPANLRFPVAVGASPTELDLYINGYRPTSLAPPAVKVWANGRSLGTIHTTTTWQTYTLTLPADLKPGKEIIIELLPSSTFVPGAKSRRELGVMLQWAQVR